MGWYLITSAYPEMPRILLPNEVLNRWKSLSALHLGTQWAGTILDGGINALLVRRHIWKAGLRRSAAGGEIQRMPE